MSFSVMSPDRYEKECDEGTKICIMCGQHNDKKRHNCYYCCSRNMVPMEEAGCIKSSDKLPVTRADKSYTVDIMVVDSMKEFNERVEKFKLATKDS